VIKQVVQRLVHTYHPLKIYLFGSYAWGTPTEDSDLDLLIVVDHSEENTYQMAVAGHRALWGLEVPKDLLVYTEKEFVKEASDVTTLCHKVTQDGITIYAKS
ncbi:MAG: nucleotidyltransferase domain-containing protein, partial [Chlamydiales bacterium]|nr:nucleotidyltransferase domain-containing protein [Chlamydiales bacterium]